MVYTFKEQMIVGKDGEATLDEYFSQWYDISPVNMDLERKGIDRWFRRKGQPALTTVEYKTDVLTQKTGNVFVETYSVLESGRYGWAWTCSADMLMYYAMPNTIYIAEPIKVREKIDKWQKKYGVRTVKNKGYHSVGIPVPAKEFKRICRSVREI